MRYLKTYEQKKGITFKEWLKKNILGFGTQKI